MYSRARRAVGRRGADVLKYRTRRVAVWLFAVAAALAFLGWVEANRIDPRTLPQTQLHQWATVGRRVSFEQTVKQHPVRIQPPARSAADMLLDYAVATVKRGSTTETQGVFDNNTGEIAILGSEARYEASLPFGFRPLFYHTLRHEYGHAAFHDWVLERGTAAIDDPYLTFLRPWQRPKRSYYAPELFDVMDEWSRQSPNVYGLQYMSATFAEYIAESYARTLERHYVPPVTKRFVMRAYGGVEK